MTPRPPRAIHIDGRAYRWTARQTNPDQVTVRVWLDTPQRTRQLAITVPSADPWLHVGEPQDPAPAITSGLVAELVRAAIAAGWQPEETGSPVRFTLVPGGGLAPSATSGGDSP